MKTDEPNRTQGMDYSSSEDQVLRIAQTLREAARNRLVSRIQTAECIQFRIRHDPEAAAAAEEFVRREKACCPFFEFEVSRDGPDLLLRIEGPREAKPLLDLLFQVTQPSAAGTRGRRL